MCMKRYSVYYQLSTMPVVCAHCGKTIHAGNVINGKPYCDFGCASDALKHLGTTTWDVYMPPWPGAPRPSEYEYE